MRAWFVTISLGLALTAGLACGDGDSDIGGACEKLCSCDPDPAETCVSDCEEEAAEAMPSAACVACVNRTACAQIFAECNDPCGFTSEGDAKQSFLPR